MATQAAPGGKVSKNQRSGVRQVHRPVLCPKGHEMVSVRIVGRGMRRMCACNGYRPLDTTLPYGQIHDRFTGKSRLPMKDKGCVPQKSS
jgi:hypothetical protein